MSFLTVTFRFEVFEARAFANSWVKAFADMGSAATGLDRPIKQSKVEINVFIFPLADGVALDLAGGILPGHGLSACYALFHSIYSGTVMSFIQSVILWPTSFNNDGSQRR